MIRCECKRGFFTLSDCPNQAKNSCAECDRSVCDEHMSGDLCVECEAKKNPNADTPASQRHRMMLGRDTATNYFGVGAVGVYYSEYEIASFAQTTSDIGEADEGDMDFMDS